MPQHPTEETMNITRKFLGGEMGTPGQTPGGNQVSAMAPYAPPRLPPQAAPMAGQRAFGQRGSAMGRPRAGWTRDIGTRRPLPRQPLPRPLPAPQPERRGTVPSTSLSDRYFTMPEPVDYAGTPQGQDLMQRVLGGLGRKIQPYAIPGGGRR